MAFDEKLADRVRELLMDQRHVAENKMMGGLTFHAIALILILITGLPQGCKKEDNGKLPEIITSAIDIITPVSAICNINIGSSSGSSISEHGACWSTYPDPDTTGNKASGGTGIGDFSVTISGLLPQTLYYIRAYATNKTGTSYGEELQITTPQDLSGQVGTVEDTDGNNYPAIGIGSQVWMTENLKTTRFNDGTPIQQVTDNSAWNGLTSAGYCWYNNDEAANKNIFGGLYNGYAALSSKVCPSGWHVPTDAEWSVFYSFIGGVDLTVPNSTGFEALPAGRREPEGTFSDLWGSVVLWSSTSASGNMLWYRTIDFATTASNRENQSILTGSSIRCVKD